MYAESALSLIVPLSVIALVVLTRRVMLSLLLGIVIAGVMMSDSALGVLAYVWMRVSSVFYSHDAGGIHIEQNSLYVFGFLLILGVLSQLMAYSGGVGAFVRWARGRIKTAKGSEFVAFIAGIVIFIDDYFNALSVGQISKSLNDANGSTRERLAYIIDSTAAPICILMPMSSWGAYIIGILDKKDLALESGALFTLVSSIWHNYYAWLALMVVFFSIYWQIYLKAMRQNVNIGVKDAQSEVRAHSASSVWLLVAPIGLLILGVLAMLFYSGYATSQNPNPIIMLQNTQTGFSLFWGGLFALIISALLCARHLETGSIFPIVRYGIGSMMPAILILVLAWAIGPAINEDMQTGQYLAALTQAHFAQNAGLALPMILFVISGFIGFATGTSWGTFAIMLPIAASMAAACGADYMLSISAVLAGAVYGDHASPISDTTILSATGAGCDARSHFITQLPYVSLAAVGALVGFGVVAFSGSVALGWVVSIGCVLAALYFLRGKYAKPQSTIKAESNT